MAPAVKTHQALLNALQTARPKLRKAIIRESDKALIYAICEICENLLLGNIPLTEDQKKKLKKYRAQLHSIAQRGEGWKRKKDVVLQRGGAFLPLLLSVVSSILPSLLSS
jgi:hypothetical protein